MSTQRFEPRRSEPGPGKKALFFYYDQTEGGYVYLPASLGARLAAAAGGEHGFERDDKIEVLVLKRIDMTQAEFEALPLVGDARVRRGGR